MSSESKRNRSWLVPALVGAGVAAGMCALIALGGWFFFVRPSSNAIDTPEPIAQFLVPTETPIQPTVTLLPTIALTPNSPATSAAPASTRAAPPPAPTLPRPTATAGPITGRIAFSVSVGDRSEDQSIWLVNVDGSGAKKIIDTASSPAFSPDGSRIAYYHWQDGVWVANIDGSSARQIIFQKNAKYIAWSHDGRWIAFSSQLVSNGNITVDAVLSDGTGGRRTISNGSMPSWSLDDSQIALWACKLTACGIHRVSSEGGDPIPITLDSGANPAWSPDSRRILYQVEVNDVKQLFVINADGSGKKQLTTGSSLHVDGQWSADGNYIFYRSPESGSWAIWRMNSDGTKSVKLIETVPPKADEWPYEKLAVFTISK